MKKVAVLVSASLASLSLVSGASTAAQAANFSDPVGDGGGAPDIVAVTATNAGDAVSVLVVFLGPVAPPANVQVTLVLDTDRNRDTGFEGFDYIFQFDARENAHALARWDGTQFAIIDAPTAAVNWSSLSVQFKINRSDLGGTGAFDFWIRSQQNPPDSELIDDAPNDGTWTYELTTAQATRVLLPATQKPRAGRVFDARAVRVQLNDGTRVAPERLTCRLTQGGVALRPLAGGCRWRIPARLRGRPIVLSVVATYGEAELRTSKRFIVGR